MQGGTTKRVTAKSIIHPAPFVRGFNEIKHGVPMDYDAYGDSWRDREAYEIGRHFGCIFKGSLKDGKKVTYEAQKALCDAFYQHHIIL